MFGMRPKYGAFRVKGRVAGTGRFGRRRVTALDRWRAIFVHGAADAGIRRVEPH